MTKPQNNSKEFPAATGAPTFYRTYSRRDGDSRESYADVYRRSTEGLKKLGHFDEAEDLLVRSMMLQQITLPSGRWMWVGGTDWSEKSENHYSCYNCNSTNINDVESFGLMMSLGMMGCGTGAVLEERHILQLPPVRNTIQVYIVGEPGSKSLPVEATGVEINTRPPNIIEAEVTVGDSRQGWVDSMMTILRLAFKDFDEEAKDIRVFIDLSFVRPDGTPIKGFGGVANPVKLSSMYERIAKVLNRYVGKQLDAEGVCLLLDEPAKTIVAGNVRRYAGMRQFSSTAPLLKEGLWQQGADGTWKIDPERDALRMANHTRVFHTKPTLAEVTEAVRKQYYSGEGAIQWAGEAVARGNCDLLDTDEKKQGFLQAYNQRIELAAEILKDLAEDKGEPMEAIELEHRMQRYALNPCVTADTWVHTEYGARQVKDLIGKQHGTYVNGELFSTTPGGFFYTGDREVFTLSTSQGYSLRLTGNHKVLTVQSQTQHKQYTDWVETKDLKPGDRVCLHDHRSIRPWDGEGTFEEGWLLGSLVGDGSLAETKSKDQGILRFWGEHQEEMLEYAVATLKETVVCGDRLAGHHHRQHNLRQVSSSGLAELAEKYRITRGNKTLTPEIEQTSYDFHRGFLQGLFDADSSVQKPPNGGVNIRLAQSNLELLEGVQRMLSRVGIVSTIYQNRRKAGYNMLPDSNRKMAPYYCKARHELAVSKDNIVRYRDTIGFRQPDKKKKLVDLIEKHSNRKPERFYAVVKSVEPSGVEPVYDCTVPSVSRFDANGIVVSNCGEISSSDFLCNLAEVHLNQLSPRDLTTQRQAFEAGALSVAALLHHVFPDERYRISRELDPIVAVCPTGLFDFFVKAFGVGWLRWWESGRDPEWDGLTTREICYIMSLAEALGEFIGEEVSYLIGECDATILKEIERMYLCFWRECVGRKLYEYCDKHGLKRPNRYTAFQPSGTKSLLTGASSGWHPPKAQRYIRRITFAADDPVAKACIDYGYNVVPSQSCKDDEGRLLDDISDPRVHEWLVEIPVEVSWANLPGADKIDINKFSAVAQFDFFMQCQQHYTRHNTSATIELREDEIDDLAKAIYDAVDSDSGYISAALLARFDPAQSSFPRLPFEPIDKCEYGRLVQEVQQRQKSSDFHHLLSQYDKGWVEGHGVAGCDSDKCLLPESR